MSSLKLHYLTNSSLIRQMQWEINLEVRFFFSFLFLSFLFKIAFWFLCLKSLLLLLCSSLSYEGEKLLSDFKSQIYPKSQGIPLGLCFLSWREE